MTTKERQKGKTELGWTQAPGLTRAAASSYAMGGSYTPAPAYGAALQNKELKELDLKPVERKETPKAPPTVRVPASMPKGTDPAALALAARRNEAAVKQTQARKEQERRTAQTSVAETTAQATAPVSVSMPTQFSASNYLTGEASMPVTPYAAGLQAGIVKTPERQEKPKPVPLPMDPEPLVFDHLSRKQKEQALETAKRLEKMPLFSGGLTTPEQNRALIDQLNKELEREDIIAMGFDPRWLALSRKQGLLTEEEKTEARAAAKQLAAQPLQVRYQEAQRAAGVSPYGQIPAMLSFERSMTPEETELFKAQYALGTALADRAGMSGPFAAAAGLVSALPGASWADREGGPNSAWRSGEAPGAPEPEQLHSRQCSGQRYRGRLLCRDPNGYAYAAGRGLSAQRRGSGGGLDLGGGIFRPLPLSPDPRAVQGGGGAASGGRGGYEEGFSTHCQQRVCKRSGGHAGRFGTQDCPNKGRDQR